MVALFKIQPQIHAFSPPGGWGFHRKQLIWGTSVLTCLALALGVLKHDLCLLGGPRTSEGAPRSPSTACTPVSLPSAERKVCKAWGFCSGFILRACLGGFLAPSPVLGKDAEGSTPAPVPGTAPTARWPPSLPWGPPARCSRSCACAVTRTCQQGSRLPCTEPAPLPAVKAPWCLCHRHPLLPPPSFSLSRLLLRSPLPPCPR